jgi:hypothetical protein
MLCQAHGLATVSNTLPIRFKISLVADVVE